MSKRQLHGFISDLSVSDLIEHDENPNLFEHLIEDFQDMMSDKQVLRNCVEKFINNTIDEFTLGIIFDMHRKFKTNAYCMEVESCEDDMMKTEELQPNLSVKNSQTCTCPRCERLVAPFRFGWHLEKCMGIDTNRTSTRNASRRVVVAKDKDESSDFVGVHSDDDDDDEDWNARKNSKDRRKKKDKNNGKKSRETSKKSSEKDTIDSVNIDIDDSFEEMPTIRYMTDQASRSYRVYLQERRTLDASSPLQGAGSSSITPKKRDNSKKKVKAGKDRGSPGSSMTLD